MIADLRPHLRGLLGLTGAPLPGIKPDQMTLLLPDGPGPHPAVLYCHAHGGRYDLGRAELTKGAPWLTAPYAPDLLQAGFAVLALDMPGFGARQLEGAESALAKAGAWQGRPLFGQMVAAQMVGLALLRQDPRIDSARIVTLGASMGAALAMWVAALDARVAGSVQLCMLANMAPLIETGAHDRHGPYLTVPGLLQRCDIGDVAALIAPRPLFIGLGAEDPMTPPAARDPALATLRHAYGTGPLTVSISPGTGHQETTTHRQQVLAVLAACRRGAEEGTALTC